MKRLIAFLCVSCSMAVGQSAQASDQCDGAKSVRMTGASDAPWAMQIEVEPTLNVPFEATITVCSKPQTQPTKVTVDAIMPAHKHGMNYKPKMEQLDRKTFKVKNMLFHMPGMWRVEVTAFEGNTPHRLTHDVSVR